MVEVAPHDLGLFPQPTGTDAEYETAAGMVVQSRDLLGLYQRVVFRDQAHRRAQHYGAGSGRRPSQPDERVAHIVHERGDRPVGSASVP